GQRERLCRDASGTGCHRRPGPRARLPRQRCQGGTRQPPRPARTHWSRHPGFGGVSTSAEPRETSGQSLHPGDARGRPRRSGPRSRRAARPAAESQGQDQARLAGYCWHNSRFMDERDPVYQPNSFEPAWAQRWAESNPFHATDLSGRPPYYVLEMLPYPSGALHMGHVRNYAIGDALARYLWMRGYDVLHPMGWDSFGLPAENAAIKNQSHPRSWTLANIAHMKSQDQRFGFSYDWSREVTTCLPDYYRWNQWLFLRFYEKGWAYRRKGLVNWCPQCATVLANEQAEGGFCWRHEDTPVERRELHQWYFRITAFADELLRDLDRLPDWPERVRTMQRNWIGRSPGAELEFAVENSPDRIRVFTTRIDTIYGASAVLLAP